MNMINNELYNTPIFHLIYPKIDQWARLNGDMHCSSLAPGIFHL